MVQMTKRVAVALLLLTVLLPLGTHSGVRQFLFGGVGFAADGKSEYSAVKVAEQNSQTISLLRAANNLDPNPSKGGGDIIVEGGAVRAETGPYGTSADIQEVPQSDRISLYVVREGDSLSQIAEMFGVSTNTIVWANDLKRGALITPGQQLLILPITGVRHTVAKGDTIASIAKKYKGDVAEVLLFNGIIEGAPLSVGSVVTVPGGEVPIPVGSTTVRPRVTGTGGPEYAGYYMNPLPGSRKTQGLHGYNGVDLGAPAGTPILASASGTVLLSRSGGWNGGYGNYVVIEHGNGTQTLYAHNSQNIVYAGQRVVAGQIIGYVGSTGRSTGSHVHFEIRGAKNPF
jgi:LysM repeat protein